MKTDKEMKWLGARSTCLMKWLTAQSSAWSRAVHLITCNTPLDRLTDVPQLSVRYGAVLTVTYRGTGLTMRCRFHRSNHVRTQGIINRDKHYVTVGYGNLYLCVCDRTTTNWPKTGARRTKGALHMLDQIGNESAPIQLAQCWFPGLAIANAKY